MSMSTFVRRVIVEYKFDELTPASVKISSIPAFHSFSFLFIILILLVNLFSSFPSFFPIQLRRCFSAMPAHAGDQVNGSSLPVNTDVGISPGAETVSEIVLMASTVLRSEVVDWTVSGYELK